ncbi:NepR family anti-sigma factor [Aestuariivita boseongensis]|uniref:NepR family anti-sigma factor n=1 Tax=Aestuariivita boseongensis TaxID=1470562 RepID=UPI0006818E1C|nr:NepR family anti-sigma factor [Aestuariivita boseongensis]
MARKRNPHMEREIDRNLKRAFDEVASEPLPERFTNLLEQLRAQDASETDDTDQDGARDVT